MFRISLPIVLILLTILFCFVLLCLLLFLFLLLSLCWHCSLLLWIVCCIRKSINILCFFFSVLLKFLRFSYFLMDLYAFIYSIFLVGVLFLFLLLLLCVFAIKGITMKFYWTKRLFRCPRSCSSSLIESIIFCVSFLFSSILISLRIKHKQKHFSGRCTPGRGQNEGKMKIWEKTLWWTFVYILYSQMTVRWRQLNALNCLSLFSQHLGCLRRDSWLWWKYTYIVYLHKKRKHFDAFFVRWEGFSLFFFVCQ